MSVSVASVTLPGGVSVFYREAGDVSAPTILLLHGFPSSSHQFRHLIPILAERYHVVAPDYPGFGFSKVPASIDFTYTFESLTDTVESFLDVKGIKTFVPYIFDYGSPVGLRLALRRPQAIPAIISQNGNAYMEGFGQAFWAPIFALWKASTPAEIAAASAPIREAALTLEGFRSQYWTGSIDPNKVEPESYWLDYALVDRPGNREIQLGLLRDYASNIELYPKFQAFFRDRRPHLLAVWGEDDIIFVLAGAEAFRKDLPDAEVHFLKAGHFPLETNLHEVASLMLNFLHERVDTPQGSRA